MSLCVPNVDPHTGIHWGSIPLDQLCEHEELRIRESFESDTDYVSDDDVELAYFNPVVISRSDYCTYTSRMPDNRGDLMTPRVAGAGVKAYCLPHEWFPEEVAPYPVWRVDTDEQVLSVRVPGVCERCKGSGQLDIREEAARTGVEASKFLEDALQGAGRVVAQPDLFDAPPTGFVECPGCRGSGQVRRRVTGTLGQVMHAMCISVVAHAELMAAVHGRLLAATADDVAGSRVAGRFGEFLWGFASAMDEIRVARTAVQDGAE